MWDRSRSACGNYNGPPLVSFDAALARGWGVRIGETIRVNVLGRDIDLKVASLRDIAWQSLSLNFTMVASPGLLEHAPHTHIATVRVAGPDQGNKYAAPTMVFIHGFGGRAAYWEYQLEQFHEHYRVVALDLRGHGYTDAPTEAEGAHYDVPELVDEVSNRQAMHQVVPRPDRISMDEGNNG